MLVHNLHIGGKKRDAAVARAEDALARHFHAAYRADSVDSTPTGGNALLVGAKRSLGRARLHENATRAGLKFDAGTPVRSTGAVVLRRRCRMRMIFVDFVHIHS